MKPLKELLKSKPKIKDRRPSWLFKLFLFLLFLAALNFALLFPPQLSALFFQLELMTLQFFNYAIIMHRWELLVLLALFALFGTYISPTIYIPAAGKHGKTYIYSRSWKEGDILWLRLLNGYHMAVNHSVITKKGLRYTIMGKVETEIYGNVMEVQTEALEVDISLNCQERNKLLMDYITKLEYEIKNSGLLIGKDEAITLMRRDKNEEQ